MLSALFAGSEQPRGILFVEDLADFLPVDEVGCSFLQLLLLDDSEQNFSLVGTPGGIGDRGRAER